MIESWLAELVKGIGKVFFNPVFYWMIPFVLLLGYRRIKRERIDFGSKIFDIFSEWKNNWKISLIAGLLISAAALLSGMVLSLETILLLGGVTVLLSCTFRLTLLSPSYTIGITFILLLVMPTILAYQSFLSRDLFSDINVPVLAMLVGMLIIAESAMIGKVRRTDTFPELSLSDRGIWVGQHRLKKVGVIPFFVLVPSGLITPFAPWWPYFSVGEATYSLMLVPFLIGFDYLAKGHSPMETARKLAKFNSLLGFGVLLLAGAGIFFPYVSAAGIILAIIGKEYLNYRYRRGDRLRRPYFRPLNEGLKIAGIIPSAPAARLDVLVGETIVKVNGRKIYEEADFYEALQGSGASFKMEVLDDNHEVRFVQGALYEGDHHELGLVFSGEPYRKERKRTG